MTYHLMIDLETMGNGPMAPIVSIGAAFVNLSADKANCCPVRYYDVVTLESELASGAVVDASTVIWWLTQSDAARSGITQGARPNTAVLSEFADWIKAGPDFEGVWGNGATFDNVITRQAFKRVGIECPWPFWADRCYRTMKAAIDVGPVERQGTHHNALDDAVTQGVHLWKIFNFLGGAK